MPLRTITLDNGKTVTRNVINLHPDGTEFLPEEFTIPYCEETKMFYRLTNEFLRQKGEKEAANEAMG